MKNLTSVAVVILPPSAIVNRPPEWTIQDWGVIFSLSIAIGSAFTTYFLSRSRSQAQELDKVMIEKAVQLGDAQANRLEKMMQRLEGSVGHLDASINHLSEKIMMITERIAIVETKQPSYDRQLEELRLRHETFERRVAEIGQQQEKVFSYLKKLTETIGHTTK